MYCRCLCRKKWPSHSFNSTGGLFSYRIHYKAFKQSIDGKNRFILLRLASLPLIALPKMLNWSEPLSIPKCPWEIYIFGKWNNCPHSYVYTTLPSVAPILDLSYGRPLRPPLVSCCTCSLRAPRSVERDYIAWQIKWSAPKTSFIPGISVCYVAKLNILINYFH